MCFYAYGAAAAIELLYLCSRGCASGLHEDRPVVDFNVEQMHLQ